MSRPRSFGAVVRDLVRIASPVALARLGIMGMGIADTVVVGRLAPDELPALALGWAPTGALLVAGIGLLLGVQVLAARAIGGGNPLHAGAVWRRGLTLSAITGIACAAGLAVLVEPLLLASGMEPALAQQGAAVARILGLSLGLHFAYVCCTFFVEAVRRPLVGTAATWAGNAVNLALNLALVPSLGARGSAWATVGGRLFLLVSLGAWILASKTGREYGVRAATPGAPGMRALLRLGSAAAVSQLAEAGAFSAMTVLAGRIGAEAVATYQLLLNVLAVVFMVSLGVATATSVLVAEAWGKRSVAEASHAAWAGLALELVVMLACATVLVAAGGAVAQASTSSAALAASVAALMPLAALILAPDGGQAVAASALRARGELWVPTASHVLSYVLVMPPLGWWLGEHLGRGVAGLMEAIAIASFLSAGVLVARLHTLRVPRRS